MRGSTAAAMGGFPRKAIRALTAQHLLRSETEKGPLRLNVPARAAAFFFPHLYPDSIEADLLS